MEKNKRQLLLNLYDIIESPTFQGSKGENGFAKIFDVEDGKGGDSMIFSEKKGKNIPNNSDNVKNIDIRGIDKMIDRAIRELTNPELNEDKNIENEGVGKDD